MNRLIIAAYEQQNLAVESCDMATLTHCIKRKIYIYEQNERLVFLGTKRTVKQHIHNNTVIYRFESEFPPVIDLRLKIEINTREHFSVLGLKQIPFQITNSWFTGKCDLTDRKAHV